MKNNEKMQKFDLFRLHDNNIDKKMKHSWIGVKSNISLCHKLNKMLNTLLFHYSSQQELGIELAKRLNCAKHSPLRHIVEITKYREHWIPLFFIESMIELYSQISHNPVADIKEDLQNDFKLLKVGNGSSKAINAVKKLDKTLCKIAGAHAADGTIKEGYRIVLSEEYKSSVESFSRLIGKSFGIKPNVIKVKGKNAWQVIFRSKVIVRYLTKFLGFPIGKKFDKVDIPIIIKKSPLEFQEAFVSGAFTFDGSVRLNKSISFSSRSKALRDSLFHIIKKSGLNIASKTGSSHNTPIYIIRTNTKISMQDLHKWLIFFEPETMKWFMVKDLIYGYRIKCNTLDNAISQLEKSLHHTVKKQVIQMVKLGSQLNIFTTKRLYQESEFRGSYNTFGSYFRFLKRCNIFLFRERKGNGSVTYLYNKHILSWRLPIGRL